MELKKEILRKGSFELTFNLKSAGAYPDRTERID